MTHVKPVFPKAVFSWTDRVNQVSNVLANDPNSMASEIISIEGTLGVNPQIEKSPISGSENAYATVDARISDVEAGNQHPYVALLRENFDLTGRDPQGLSEPPGQPSAIAKSTFNRSYDPFDWYNGSDITVKATGLYIIKARTTWEWFNQGYLMTHMYINGSEADSDIWYWTPFISAHAPGRYAENRWATTSLTWLGAIQTGSRITIGLENATNQVPYHIINNELRVYCLRKLPPGTNQF